MLKQGDILEFKDSPEQTFSIVRKIESVSHLNQILSRICGPPFKNLNGFADEKVYPVFLVKNIGNHQIWLISHGHTYLNKENVEVINESTAVRSE